MKLIVFLSFLILFLFKTPASFAQLPAIEWQKCLGGNNGEYARSIEPTTDGGYIVGGNTEGLDNGDIMGYHGNAGIQDYWIVKLNNTGSIQWQKCLGGNYSEVGAVVRQTADGGYIVAGSSVSSDCSITGNHGGLDFWIVKLKPDGEIEWQKMFGGDRHEYAWSLDLTSDGGYVVAGSSQSANGDVTVNHGNEDFWIIKIDGSGNLQWQKSLGGSGIDEAYSVKATTDGGCIVAGHTRSNDGDVTGNHGAADMWVTKLDNTGNLQWQKCMGGSMFEDAQSVQLTSDGGYIVAGYTSSNNGDVTGNHSGSNPGADYWIVKLTNSGSIQWQKCYGGNINEYANHIEQTPDGGYIICGSALSSNGDATCNAGNEDMWIIKIGNTGTLEWQKSIGGNYVDEAVWIKPLSDGGYILCGAVCSSNISGYHPITNNHTCADFWIIKLSAPALTPPLPSVSIDTSSINVCASSTSTITATVRYAGLNTTYQWQKNGINVGGNNPFHTASGFANNDVIRCIITSSGACEQPVFASDSKIIRINNSSVAPIINITADNTVVCPCTTVTLKAIVTNSGPAPRFQWKLNGINTGENRDIFISNKFQNGDIITCEYSDNTTCIAGGSVLSNPIQITAASGQVPVVSIIASNNNICTASSVTYTANTVNAGTNPTYQWKINGVNTGTNNKTFTTSALVNGDQVSCKITFDPLFTCVSAASANSNIVTMIVTTAVTPSLSISASANNICSGSPVTFTAIPVSAGTNPSFQWLVNGANSGTNSNTFTTTALSNGDIISCKITADPAFTCLTSVTALSNNLTVSVINGSVPSVNIVSSANNVCNGTIITITASAINAGTSPSYHWKLNNVNVGTNSNVLSINYLRDNDQVYCEVIPGNNACTTLPVNSNIISFRIYPSPVISIVPKDTIILSGNQVQLHATTSDIITSYQWSPTNKLQNPASLHPTTVPLTASTSFTLNVVNNNGCTASNSVIIKTFTNLYMPNSFTPNGDRLNDVFRIPKDVSLQLDEFSIYDQWANKVFTTKNINEGWNGIFKGNPATAGVYVYIIKGSNDKGRILLKNSLLLIR